MSFAQRISAPKYRSATGGPSHQVELLLVCWGEGTESGEPATLPLNLPYYFCESVCVALPERHDVHWLTQTARHLKLTRLCYWPAAGGDSSSVRAVCSTRAGGLSTLVCWFKDQAISRANYALHAQEVHQASTSPMMQSKVWRPSCHASAAVASR